MLTAERLREVLSYDPISGVFRWRIYSGGKRKAGEEAGGPDGRGYIAIWVDRKPFKAHRLAWLYMTGHWPAEEIDHRDLRRDNNAWTNLREATRRDNRHNQPRPKNNRSGFKGVCWNKTVRRWQASITNNGRTQYLGCFLTAIEAHAAYVKAAHGLYGEFARTA